MRWHYEAGTIGACILLAGGAAALGWALHASMPFMPSLWPAAGVALGLFLVRGWRCVLAVGAGVLLAGWMLDWPLWHVLVMTLGTLVGAGISAFTLRRTRWFDHGLHTFQDLLLFLVWGVVIGPAVAALFVSVLMSVGAAFEMDDVPVLFIISWIGFGIGTLVTAPLLMTWREEVALPMTPARRMETALFLVLLVISCQVAFGDWLPASVEFVLTYVPFSIAVAMAYRLGPPGGAIGVAVTVGFAASYTAVDIGPFAGTDEYVALPLLWIFEIVVGIMTLAFASLAAERRRYEQSLERAADDAQKSSDMKSGMLADMSHDIRTPLTGIIGFADLLVEQVAPEHREPARIIHSSGVRLLHTLNSVLDLSKIEAGKLELSEERFNLVEEVQEHVRLLEHTAHDRGLYLEMIAEREEIEVRADRRCVGRVIDNLVSNALKYTDEGGVTVEVNTSGSFCLLHVVDTGRGIPPEFMPHLFDAFEQANNRTVRDNDSSAGLGLAITSRLVELMGGQIEVDSELGRGSTFTVRLPIGVRSPAPGEQDLHV